MLNENLIQTTTREKYLEHSQFSAVSGLHISGLSRDVIPRSTQRYPVLAALDLTIMAVAGFLAFALYRYVAPADALVAPGPRLWGLLGSFAMLVAICNALQGEYSRSVLSSSRAFRTELPRSFALSAAPMVAALIANQKHVPPVLFSGAILLGLAGMVSVRYGVRRQTRKRIERGVNTQHVLVVGAGATGQALQRYLQDNPHLGKVFCGFVDGAASGNPSLLGGPHDLPRLVKEHFIDEIYFTGDVSRDVIVDLVAHAREDRVGAKSVPSLYDGAALGDGMAAIGDTLVLELNHLPKQSVALFFKRVLDLALASTALLIAAPVMLVSALAIKLNSRGPVFYIASRVGRKGRTFRCYKFRTMVVDADARKDDLRHLNERSGATFKIANDPRITSVGRYLRKYSIDELPQLFNVLRGEMSMVGPRPHPLDDYRQYQLKDMQRLQVLPGITGLWQVSARQDPSFEKNISLDLEYVENWSFALDVKILLRTVPEVFRGSGH